jgi:hypothetical protein
MLRLLKTVSVIFALTALSLITTSCGSSGSAQIRLVDALSNNGSNINLDVEINGAKINSNPLGFGSVYPTQATPAVYLGVSSGSDTIEVFDTGTTSNPIIPVTGTTLPTLSLSGGTQYTLVLGGSHNNASNPPTTYLFTDDNTAPTTGNLLFRIIDGSVNTPPSGGFNVYIYQTSGGRPANPQITGLTLGNEMTYSLPWVASTSYTVQFAYPNGTQIFSWFSTAPNNQQITTLVIQDYPSGSGIYPQPIVMTDLN